jgi:hypothetical protein
VRAWKSLSLGLLLALSLVSLLAASPAPRALPPASTGGPQCAAPAFAAEPPSAIGATGAPLAPEPAPLWLR